MTGVARRDQLTDAAADAAIEQACRILRLPTIRERYHDLAAAAARQLAGYKGFLVELRTRAGHITIVVSALARRQRRPDRLAQCLGGAKQPRRACWALLVRRQPRQAFQDSNDTALHQSRLLLQD